MVVNGFKIKKTYEFWRIFCKIHLHTHKLMTHQKKKMLNSIFWEDAKIPAKWTDTPTIVVFIWRNIKFGVFLLFIQAKKKFSFSSSTFYRLPVFFMKTEIWNKFEPNSRRFVGKSWNRFVRNFHEATIQIPKTRQIYDSLYQLKNVLVFSKLAV